jgi:glutamate/tyrosine decarboxylase-like PLP-dependent enzyme
MLTPDPRLDQLRRELAEPMPHPDPARFPELAGPVLSWIQRHWATLAEQPVCRTAGRQEMDARLQEPPPEDGQDFDRVFAEFQDQVAPFAFRVTHPRFLAFVPSAPTVWSVLGELLCSGTNFFGGVWLEAAGPSQVELVVLDWFKEFLGYPPGAAGLLTSGGSEANLTALVTARERLAEGERGRAVLYVSEQRHWSVDRAAKVIGLRADQFRPVPVDGRFRCRPEALREAVADDRRAGRLPWAVVANAGATNTGAVDPLEELTRIGRDERLWLHVDAAYGWPAVLTPEGRAACAGLAGADSITLDPHKWFAQAFESGCLLVREGRLLEETFALRPDYLQDVEPGGGAVNFADRGLALTRRFRALKIWLSVKVLGVRWFRELVARSCRLAEFAEVLLERTPGFEVLCTRQLSVVCFRCLPPGSRVGQEAEEEADRLNLALVERLAATGRAFVSSTRLHGRVALRFCFVNWRTTAADVEEVVRLLAELRTGSAGG